MLGLYGFSAYSASKFAVEGLAQSLRNELSITKAKVCVLYPPDTDTPMLEKENLDKPEVTKAISDGVLQSPEYVAKAALKGIAKGTYEIVPGFKNRVNCFLIRHFPTITRIVLDRTAKQVTAKA